jgi:hypothetical protein
MEMMRERIPRNNRIGIDIDDKNILNLMVVYYGMKNLTDIVQVYETKHGFHVLGYFPNVDVEKSFTIRHLLRDCKGRLGLDMMRFNGGVEKDFLDVLFEDKIKKGVRSGETYFYIDSMPFWGNGLKWCKGDTRK